MAKKTSAQSTKQRPARLKFVKKYKILAVEGARVDYTCLVKYPKYVLFFSYKYCLGVELAPANQVIKKLKMDHLWLYTLCPTGCRNGYRK